MQPYFSLLVFLHNRLCLQVGKGNLGSFFHDKSYKIEAHQKEINVIYLVILTSVIFSCTYTYLVMFSSSFSSSLYT